MVHGRQCAMFDEPKTTTHDAPTAAAICAMPLSLPTKSFARAANAVISGKDKLSNPTTRADEYLLRDCSTGFSFGATTATGVKLRAANAATTCAKFSVAHCLVANAAAG